MFRNFSDSPRAAKSLTFHHGSSEHLGETPATPISSWWLNQPIWKIWSSNWESSSPNRDEPRFPWNKGISLSQLPFGVRSCEVAIIWPDFDQPKNRRVFVALHWHDASHATKPSGCGFRWTAGTHGNDWRMKTNFIIKGCTKFRFTTKRSSIFLGLVGLVVFCFLFHFYIVSYTTKRQAYLGEII